MMKYYNFILIPLCVCSFCVNGLFGQPVILWDKIYGADNRDVGTQMVATKDGGCIFTAWPFEPGNGDIPEKKGGRDVWACRLDSNGEMVYSRILGGSEDDYTASVIRTDDGGAIFQYVTLSSDWDIPYLIGENDIVFHKLDKDGKTDWVKMFGCSKGDSGLALQKDDGNFLMYVYYGENDGDMEGIQQEVPGQLIVEFDQEGNPLWKIPVGLVEGETFSSRVAGSNDGGFLLGINSKVNNNNQGQSDFCVLKYSKERVLEWESCFGDESINNIEIVVEIPNKGFLIGTERGLYSEQGSTGNTVIWGQTDISLYQVDYNGALISNVELGGSDTDGIEKMILTDEGKSALLLCYTASEDGDVGFNHGKFDIWLVKIDLATSDIIWEKTYGSHSSSEQAVDMVELEDGSLIVLGEIIGPGGDGDVTGKPQNPFQKDIWVFKLAPENIVKSETCNSFSLSPNPVNGNTIELSFNELIQTATNVRVYDMKGALVVEHPNLLLPNSWEAKIELPDHLPAGIYLVQVNGCNDTPLTEKFLKLN